MSSFHLDPSFHSAPSSHSAPPLSLRGLDYMNNPIMDDGLGTRSSDEALAAVPPIRDVDWHAGPQEILGPARRRAAHGQRCGMVAPQGQACHRCTHGKRVFSTCVVNKVDGVLQSKGSCMNCDWLGESSRCSFRQNPSLPDWVVEYANGQVQPAATSSSYEANKILSFTALPSDSQQRPSPTAAPFTPGPDPVHSMAPQPDVINLWYTSPRHHLDNLQKEGWTMTQIQQELIQANQQIAEDLAWATNEIMKEGEGREQS